MTRAAAIALVLLFSRAEAVDLKARSVSNSKQFIIFCQDAALRGRVVGFVEEVKTDTLRLLGESDRWKIPVVISLERAVVPSAVETPVAVLVQETPEGPKIQIDVRIGDDPAAVNLQRHIVRTVLLEFAYRERAIRGGQPIVDPPWWLVAGIVESIRQRDAGVDTDLFRRLVATNKMPTIEQFLSQHTDDLGAAAQAMDDAGAMALFQLLLEQPAGQNSLVRLLRQWPELHDDPFVLAIGPVCDATRAVALEFPGVERLLHPDRRAGRGIERLDQTHTVRGVQHALHHDRRGAEVV